MDYPMDIDDHRSGFCWHICVTFNSWLLMGILMMYYNCDNYRETVPKNGDVIYG